MAMVPFDFNGFELRTLGTIEAPLFVASDVCAVLDISNVSDACNGLDDDEKLLSVMSIAGQKRELLCLTESGLYSLVIRSRKPQAKLFRKWLTSEVIPAIRKTGSYTVDRNSEYKLESQKMRQEFVLERDRVRHSQKLEIENARLERIKFTRQPKPSKKIDLTEKILAYATLHGSISDRMLLQKKWVSSAVEARSILSEVAFEGRGNITRNGRVSIIFDSVSLLNR